MVDFKFKENTFGSISLTNQQFVSKLNSENILLSYENSIEQLDIELIDESTKHDFSLSRKRFRVKYFSDLEVSNIDLRLIYPNFGRFTELSCPSFAIRD